MGEPIGPLIYMTCRDETYSYKGIMIKEEQKTKKERILCVIYGYRAVSYTHLTLPTKRIV